MRKCEVIFARALSTQNIIRFHGVIFWGKGLVHDFREKTVLKKYLKQAEI